MKKLIVILIFFAFPLCGNSDRFDIYEKNEYLEYRVSFWGITLGHIKVFDDGKQMLNGIPIVKARIKMKSAPSIPFVELDAEFQSWMDTSFAFSHKFVGIERKEEGESIEEYKFDYKNKKLYSIFTEYDKKPVKKTYNTCSYWNEGTSLYFFARKHVSDKKKYVVPTIINLDTATTVMNMKGEKEKYTSDIFDYPVKSVYFSGKAHWEGIYGMSGNFEGWVSDDPQAIPLLAKMSVYVGNVNIELVKWRRKDWKAPKYY